jgi:inner membrane protein
MGIMGRTRSSDMNIAGRISRSMGFKAMLMGILILVMLVPAALVRQVVRERSSRAEEVEWEILQSWGGELQFAGPVLRIPCSRIEEVRLKDDKGRETTEYRQSPFDLWVSPATLEMSMDMESMRKSRGIFSVPVFSGTLEMSGVFEVTEALASLSRNETAWPGDAELVVSIANQKGLRGLEQALWKDSPLEFKPGNSGLDLLNGGIHAPAAIKSGERSSFKLNVSVQGGRRIWMLPLGETTHVTMAADWPAPSYQGEHLPGSQSLDASGFEAAWDISYLSRGIPLYWRGSETATDKLAEGFFGVDFFEVLDRYTLNDRATKYAILFIVVPFLALFMLELFTRRVLHPIQYLLAGIANMVFYLLLLSLSEHIPFGAAYLASAAAVGVMVFLYSWSIFKDVKKAWYMGPVMGTSYLYLFITLQSEDWALLIGALGAFGVTALVMFVTRNVNWYSRDRLRVPDIEPDDTPDINGTKAVL